MSTTRWTLDPSHSGIHFSIRHLMFAKVRGRFARWTGVVDLDEQDVTRSSVSVVIEAGSIDTSEAKRDAHLRSADFFDVDHFPELRFASKRIEAQGDALQLIGDLTIHGVTREVALAVDRLGGGKDPWGNQRLGFSAKTTILRKDFGLTWNAVLEAGGVAVGDKVEIEIEAEAVAAQLAA